MKSLSAHWEMFAQDVRFSVRTLSRSHGFAAATILVTALGVGANTATFSVADYVLLRPLPYPDSETLVRICEGPPGGGGWGCNNQMSPANYRDLATMNTSLATIGAFRRTAMNLVGGGEPARVSVAMISSEVLPLLGIAPMVGRAFAAGEERTAILSFPFWHRQFGGASRAVGTTLTLDGTPHVVIGVMPPHFRFPTEEVQLWVPLTLREAEFTNRANTSLEGVARLRPGVSFEQARADATAIAARLAREYPDTNAERWFSFFRQRDEMSPRFRTMLLALCGASLCMLLLTCATLANLWLARSAGRARELAVRAALGAGRERLIRQMLTESVSLALIGGVAGALVAVIAVPLLAHLVPPTLPLTSQPTIDVRVFGFAVTFAALTALGFGLLPALRAGSSTGISALREGARGSASRTRLRTILIALEVGVSVVLLVSSGLLIRAIWRVQSVDPGFRTDSILTLRTALPTPRYSDPVRRANFYRHVIDQVRALPGVESVAYTSGLPMVMTANLTMIQFPGKPRPSRNEGVSLRIITPQFFETLRIPLQRGRPLSDADTRDRALVAVVSESFARRYWTAADPIGQTFETRGQVRTVVGVVGDIKVRGLERVSEPQLYLPVEQVPDPIGEAYLPKDLLVRSARPEPALVAAIRAVIHQVDPQQPLSDVRMLAEVVGDQTLTRRAQVRVLAALAVLALLLTAVGIHGLLAFTVAQRDREIGVRLALGATPRGVARMILSEGIRIALIGVVPGIFVAYLAARGMSTLLFGVQPGDPLTFSMVALVCLVTAVAACVHPALRAATIQPMSALKTE
jgi:putative ABC transport system permease protein